jgi:hypothetical protein
MNHLRFLPFSACLGLLFLMAACGGAQAPPPPTPTPHIPPPEPDIHIHYYVYLHPPSAYAKTDGQIYHSPGPESAARWKRWLRPGMEEILARLEGSSTEDVTA